jgi:hypothetical protein
VLTVVESLKALCCSSRDGAAAQPDEKVWTLATAGPAGGDRPATAPGPPPITLASNRPDTPPATSTGPPRRRGGKTAQATAADAVRGIRATRAYRLRFGQVGWAPPTAPRAAGSRAPVRAATSRVARERVGGTRSRDSMAGAGDGTVPRWDMCDAELLMHAAGRRLPFSASGVYRYRALEQDIRHCSSNSGLLDIPGQWAPGTWWVTNGKVLIFF